MTNWKARLESLERSRGVGGKGPLALFYRYGEAVPVPPPGYAPITLVQEVVVVGRDWETGEWLVEDPAGGPPIRVASTDDLPDRSGVLPRGGEHDDTGE